MAKVIYHGLAKPDDPIYRSGTVVGGKRFGPSTVKPAPKPPKEKPKPK